MDLTYRAKEERPHLGAGLCLEHPKVQVPQHLIGIERDVHKGCRPPMTRPGRPPQAGMEHQAHGVQAAGGPLDSGRAKEPSMGQPRPLF